ncbi:Uncharacterized protein FWK35_00028214 [Aphis craccivora]|uniref:Uncharacterized protein n=1 Tax=Aphis craccivora TaxID=307492 RepID=A0A6G0VWK4_APHCR|nr:Uncharacterized protein FWK35_00028214 [Aphis craccivora]
MYARGLYDIIYTFTLYYKVVSGGKLDLSHTSTFDDIGYYLKTKIDYLSWIIYSVEFIVVLLRILWIKINQCLKKCLNAAIAAYAVPVFPLLYFLDSERSDECIDFTMKCVFFLFIFVSVTTVRKNPKKVTEKREFLRKTSFRPNRFFYMVVNQKLITRL